MKRVEVKLNLEAVAPLLDVIKDAADDLRPKLAVSPTVPDQDEEFSGEWKRELLESQNSDITAFLSLFGAEFFISGMVPLDANNREAILRACSAVRLRLRQKHLRALGDEALESGKRHSTICPKCSTRHLRLMCFLRRCRNSSSSTLIRTI